MRLAVVQVRDAPIDVGARLLLAPSPFGRERRLIWETATVARALENGAWLAAAGCAGTSAGIAFNGQIRVRIWPTAAPHSTDRSRSRDPRTLAAGR